MKIFVMIIVVCFRFKLVFKTTACLTQLGRVIKGNYLVDRFLDIEF